MPRQFYIPDEQRLATILKQQARSLSDVQRPTGTERERTLLRLQQAVDELQARTSSTVTAASVSAVANDPGTGTAWGQASRSITIPAPAGGSRYADVSITGALSGGSSTVPERSVTAYLMLLYGSTVLDTQTMLVPGSGSSDWPPGWGTRFNLMSTQLVGLTPQALTLRIHVSAFGGGGTVTVTGSALSATVRYGQRS
ncbi:hypothetical protein [Acinetobacter pragensis]|uniref:hypothetical protein n=1 Tax=Acinetobacter pragensis TaxID=1806892 RepID=UPI0033409FD4